MIHDDKEIDNLIQILEESIRKSSSKSDTQKDLQIKTAILEMIVLLKERKKASDK